MPILKPKQPRQAPPSPVKKMSRTTLLVLAMGMVFGILAPASAQFFGFGFPSQPPRPQRAVPQQQPGGFGGFFAPFESQQPKEVRPVDYSRAPAPKKQEFPPERSVLVLGDAMADWLAYGLEDAFAENNDLGVIRRHKTVSGLIRYQPKGDPADWAAAAKGILAKEKPDAIVVMLGLHDRTAIREPVVEKKKEDPAKKDAKVKPGDAKPGDAKPGEPKAADAKPEVKPDGAPTETPIAAKPEETKPDSEADADDEQPQIAAPERGRAGALHEFREDRWVELYSKKIDEMIAVVKSKGVPVIWVGLPALRGPKGTSDMLFLDALYRDAAGRAGITYVDVWDGFVDEAGRFMPQGPDFEGQIRRLRTADGVFFTKAGARKLAHYTDREIRRVLAVRSSPLALPSEPTTPDLNARPDAPAGPAPRPLAGPILPLVASSIRSDELLGGTGTRPAAIDALAARTLVKGEAIASIAGRADDFMWPRREIGRLEPGATPPTPVAAKPATTPNAASVASTGDPAAAPKPKRPRLQPQQQPAQSTGGWFGFQQPAPQPVAPPQQQRPRIFNLNAPRPPGSVGPSASAPGGGFFR